LSWDEKFGPGAFLPNLEPPPNYQCLQELCGSFLVLLHSFPYLLLNKNKKIINLNDTHSKKLIPRKPKKAIEYVKTEIKQYESRKTAPPSIKKTH
jgi:hypothetical protein